MRVPSASRQIAFHQLLVGARKKWLLAALAETLAKVDPVALKREIARLVPKDAQKILAEAGIRDEHVFPTPLVLEAQPSLVGYYRLLLGAPQKSFYSSGSGLSRFKVAIEIKGGTDKSNAHNRSGEAEKSHLKARKADFRDFWTIISKKGLNMGIIRSGSPTTTSWFDVSEIVGRSGDDFEEFRGRISDAVGIAVGPAATVPGVVKKPRRKKR